MKDAILATIVIVLLGASCAAWADIVIDDGGVHDIDYAVSEPFRVRDGGWGAGDYTTVNVLDGAEFTCFVSAQDHTRLNIYGGLFAGPVSVSDHSFVNLSGGSLQSGLRVRNSAHVTVSGSAAVRTFVMSHNTVGLIDGGVFTGDFFVRAGSSLTITGGEFGASIALGGEVHVTGGRFWWQLRSGSQGMTTIDGGVFEAGVGADRGTAEIRGGQLYSQLICTDGGLIRLAGHDFKINDREVTCGTFASDYDLGEPTTYRGLDCRYSMVSGVLNDGSEFSVPFYLIQTGVGAPTGPSDIQFIPEPVSLWLLLAGGWVLRSGRRRARPGRC